MVTKNVNQQGEQPQLNVDMSKTREIACLECGGQYFKPVIKLRYLSPILAPNGKALVLPMDALICDECNMEINDDFIKKFESGDLTAVTDGKADDGIASE